MNMQYLVCISPLENPLTNTAQLLSMKIRPNAIYASTKLVVVDAIYACFPFFHVMMFIPEHRLIS